MVEKEDNEKEKVLEMNIDELELSVRSYNCLKRAGINTVEELCNRTPEDMMKVRNLGRKSPVQMEISFALNTMTSAMKPMKNITLPHNPKKCIGFFPNLEVNQSVIRSR